MFVNPFEHKEAKQLIPKPVDIVVVADLFADKYLGCAELTTEALLGATELTIHRINSKDISMETSESGYN